MAESLSNAASPVEGDVGSLSTINSTVNTIYSNINFVINNTPIKGHDDQVTQNIQRTQSITIVELEADDRENDTEIIEKQTAPGELPNIESTFRLKEVARESIKFLEVIHKGQFTSLRHGTLNSKMVTIEDSLENNMRSKESITHQETILMQVNHRHIIRLLAKTTNGPACHVMEFMKRGSLQKYLQCSGVWLTFKERVIYCHQISNGMSYLAKKNLVHGNLKARRVLLDSNGICKLSGFGYSCYEEISVAGLQFAYRWAAPEVFTKLKMVLKSDVWSYGVTVFEIFTNAALPYKGKTNDHVKRDVMLGKHLEKMPSINDDIYQILLQCWSHDPERRPEFSNIEKFFASQLEKVGIVYANSTQEEVKAVGENFNQMLIRKERLKLRDLISRGYYGSLHKGFLENKLVTVETSKPDNAVSRDYFIRQERILLNLNHQHIVKLLAKTTEDPICHVFEFMENGRLADYLRNNENTNLEDLLSFCQQIASGMEYISQKKYSSR